ncbi:hypothetical protein GCM10028803_39150 [Larkinella knui]|uniref:DUF2029 domain-containing protein n=1 Tax=Larkinella knui TaxID=2025310 RepID=A0A3P1CES5_9BACT|nr:hypothetical protein [Larkinella knui]RRB11758.1 hypothetical protein EHT87_25155 [Larkinella knui]
MFIVYAKVITSLLVSIVLLVAVFKRSQIESFLDQKSVPWLLIFWIILRLIPFVAVYLIFDFSPQSDVAHYYYRIGSSAKSLEIPYRDVNNPYSPFFGFWMAIPLMLWNNTRSLVLFLTLIELLAVWLTYQTYQDVMPRRERLFRVLFYLLLPVPFVMSILSGQEDVALWIFALLAVVLLKRDGNEYLCGLVLALGILSTKAVFILIILPFFLLSRRLVPFMAGLATLGLPVLIFLYIKTGMLFIEQPLEEGKYLKSPNWASVLHPWTSGFINPDLSVWNYAGLVLCLLVGAQMLRLRGKHDYRTYFPLFYIATFSIMTVVQKNAVANYTYLFMLPLVFQMVDFRNRSALLFLVLFNVAAAVHPSFWWRIGQPYYRTVGEIFNNPVYALDYAMEVFIVSYLLYLVIKARKQLKQAPNSGQIHRAKPL